MHNEGWSRRRAIQELVKRAVPYCIEVPPASGADGEDELAFDCLPRLMRQ
jgi:hypothetical protein